MAIITSSGIWPPPVSAQSAHGSPVISPSCSGVATSAGFFGAISGSLLRSGLNAASGWTQNRSPTPNPGATFAPLASALASSSSPRTFTGSAIPPRTADRLSPRAIARSPALDAVLLITATTLPVCRNMR